MLIGAVWLLLLCTSLVAILMLRANDVSKTASIDALDLQRDLDLDAATQTVVAEMMIEGPRSRWWRVPAQGSVTLGSRPLQVTITSESGRLDLNDGDPAVIAGALQGLGYPAALRSRFMDALATTRQAGRIGSTARVDELLKAAGDRPGNGQCLADMFTTESGLQSPDLAKAPPSLAQALGAPATGTTGVLQAGESLRVSVSSAQGIQLLSVARIGLLGGNPIAVSHRWLGPDC